MKHSMRLAVIAAGFLAAPASAQRLADFPPAGQVSATDTVLGQQPSLCVSTTTVCNGVLISISQLSTYILPGGSAPSAAKWTTPRTVTATGDVSWAFTLDGSANVAVTTTIATVPIAKGGTGATTISAAQAALNVAAIGADPTYAKLAGAAFTGGVTGTTASFSGSISASNFSGSSSGTNTGDQTLAGLGGQPASPILSAFAAQVLNADTCVYWTGASSAATYACPTFGRKLVGSATGAAAAATIGTSYVLARSTTAQSVTGSTSETTLATITIPAGAIGANGFVEIIPLFTVTSSANGKNFLARLNGAQIAGQSVTTNPAARYLWITNNTNSQAAQVSIAGNGIGATGSAALRTAVDTSAATTLTITCTLSTASETCTLESYLVRITYGQ